MSFINPNSPNNVMSGVYYCNQEKLDTMNREISQRNIPSQSLQMVFDPRQVPTRYTHFSVLDCKPVAHEVVEQRGPYQQDSQFNPGSSAPYQGFASNIDQESRVKNMFMPIQKFTGQTQYVPSSKSSLYQEPNTATSKPVQMNHPMLFEQQQFASFNPNQFDLGNNVLYNHTRQQVKNIKQK